MKTGNFIILSVLILYSFQVSHQSASQETALTSSQTWPEGNQPEEYKEEEKSEEEPPRRPRGKRRRRLRKRQRTQVEEIDRTNNPEYGHEIYHGRSEVEEEGVTPLEYPRRRPGKRRRRPYRRHQDEEGTPLKPLRRRRKGGRKKIRPEIHEEIFQTEIPQESLRNEDNYEMEMTTSLPKINLNIEENLTEEKVTPTEANIKIYQPTNEPITKDVNDEKLISNAVRTEKDDTSKDKTMAYGNKIFDRKKLFSNSRRMLPVTSAVIRRLNPTGKTNVSDSQNEQVKTEKPQINSENITEKSKLIMKTNFIPESHIAPTEIIKLERLIEEVRYETKNKVQNVNIENETVDGEEPNYPKVLPKLLKHKNNKDQEMTMTTYSAVENAEINQTEKPTTSFPLLQNKTMEEEFEKMMDNLDLESFNITNFNDYILELLKTKSGKEYLSKILESRNMTLPQLLEHRERGSSQFHLFEIFPQKKNNQYSSTQVAISTPTTIAPPTSTNTPAPKETSNIIFPSEEILQSFPKFLTGEIEKLGQKIEKEVITESIIGSNKDSREPRLFESMPEFITTTLSSKSKEEKPTWRVIPNPKFRPVSVRGNYEEIPVSHVLNKPVENTINDLYLVDEAETNKKYGHTSIDSTKRDSFSSFKKIPVGVKSAIIISGIILAVATFGFLSLLISCRVRQRKSMLRAKQDLMCEHLQNEDFMASQHSLSPVLTKHQQVYSSHDAHSNPNNRHYYLWRTIRRTFRYD